VVSRRGNVSLNPRMLPMHLRHRALFVGYAPAENPTIAVAVVVEGGGFGASTAAPIARTILDAWILGKMPEGAESADATATPAATGTPAAAPPPAATTAPTTAATTAATTTPAPTAAKAPATTPAVTR
jgi:penicillin-binding protein 2